MTRAEASTRPSKITVPERANPLAKLVFAEMQRQNVTYDSLEWASGVLRCTIKAWRQENKPGLETIEACLGALGWALVPVPRMDRLPPEIVEGLNALNEKWGREEPLLHHLLASACLAPILVDKGETVEAAATVVASAPAPARRRKVGAPSPYQSNLFGDAA